MVFKAQLGCALYHKHSLVWTQDTQKSECASQGSVYLLTGYRFEEALRRVGAISLPAIAVSAMLATSPYIVRRCAKRAGTDTNQRTPARGVSWGQAPAAPHAASVGALPAFPLHSHLLLAAIKLTVQESMADDEQTDHGKTIA